MRFVKKIPPTDKELSVFLVSNGWKKIKEPSSLFFTILCSVPLMLINGILAYFVMKPFYDPIGIMIRERVFSFEINLLAILLGLPIFFLFLLFHELLHALFIPNFVKSEEAFCGINAYVFFVGTTQKLSKLNFMMISVAPFILLSFIFPLVFGLLNLLNGFVYFLVIYNAMASSVDILNLILIIFQVPKNNLIINNGFETYYQQ